MKKLLVALALLTVSTVGYADDDRYKVTAGYSVDYPVIIVDTKTGDIAWCSPSKCRIQVEDREYTNSFSGNFKKAFKQKIELEKSIKAKNN
jgi:hypothetical protein